MDIKEKKFLAKSDLKKESKSILEAFNQIMIYTNLKKVSVMKSIISPQENKK